MTDPVPSSGTPSCVIDDDKLDNDVAFTCRFTAGLRHVESHLIRSPLLGDDLAYHLAGATAVLMAQRELETLSQQQGPDKHLRVPARSRLLDDLLQSSITKVMAAASCGSCNVVALGAGMDTRPWRLNRNSAFSSVNWFDVDFPVITGLKCKLLMQARAQTDRRHQSEGVVLSPESASDCTSLDTKTVGSHTAKVSSTGFPLQTASWTAVPVDLAELGSLTAALEASGFKSDVPTIWLAEAVLYYMPIEQAAAALSAAASLSQPHSMLLATCVDAELLQASRNLQAGHVFANLFLFDIKDLLENGLGQHWVVEQPPETTKALAARLLNADCYVAEYGGAECLFTAHFR